jgi:hypothetical protein
MPSEAEQVVERMLHAYERKDLDEMLDCFIEDAVYDPMPSIPSRNAGTIERVEGKPAIRQNGVRVVNLHDPNWRRYSPPDV